MNLVLSYCRLLKKLREKDARQIELEKKEQGFALYLNGANLSQRRGRPHPQAPPTSRKSRHPTSDHQQARPSKTAGRIKLKIYCSCTSDLIQMCLWLQIPITFILEMVLKMRRAELRLPLQRERAGYTTPLNSGLRMEIQSTSRPLVRS